MQQVILVKFHNRCVATAGVSIRIVLNFGILF